MTSENLDVADGTDDYIAETFASPIDPNLNGYMEDLVVQSVVSMGEYELMVVLTGGTGFITSNGEQQEFSNVKELQLMGSFVEDPANAEIVAMTLDIIEEWRASGSKLQLSAAPDKITTLLDEDGDWVPLPCFMS